MKHKLLILFILLGIFASCERDIFSERDYTSGQTIKIMPQPESSSEGIISRGTPIVNVSGMTDIGVFCAYTGSLDWSASVASGKMFNTSLVRNSASGRWEYSSGPISWNAINGNDRYSFFAYAPYATSQNGITVQGNATTAGIPSLTYAVPSNAALQPDLMLAVPRYNLRPSTSMISLNMKHALTCVGFQVQGNGEKVKSLTLSGIYSNGTASINGETIVWTPTVATSSYSPLLNYDSGASYYTATPTMSTNLLPGNGYLMMIPQTLGASALMTITFADNTTRSLCISGQWIAGKKITYNIIITEQGIISITPATLFIPQLGVGVLTDNVSLTCSPTNLNWSITTSDSWLRLNTVLSTSGATQTISGTGAATIYTVADVNNLTTDRSATIYVQGRCPRVPLSTVTQLKSITPSELLIHATPLTNISSYVGAFWRASQTGERIIRIPIGANAANVGSWKASIVWQDANWNLGDILFSTVATLDPAVSFTALSTTPSDAEAYKVTENRTVASGNVPINGVIYFRVGLRNTFNPTPTTPARYAILALSYKGETKTQFIFIRQGDGADYLMRPTDAISGAFVSATRPLARKFQCYNITSPWVSTWSGGVLITDHPQISPAGGALTSFPTQAGGMFQWAITDVSRRVFHPITPETLLIGGWSNNVPLSYWKEGSPTLESIHEICPAGYRRVNDGEDNVASSGLASKSELRQSLLSVAQNGFTTGNINTVAGYYADGFFDRRYITTSTSNFAATAVSYFNGIINLENAKVAYIGTLFYNPNNWASLFFPSSGSRAGATLSPGVPIGNAGQYGFYWTASGNTNKNNAYAMVLGLSSSRVTVGNEFNKSSASSLRCVKIP